jgi:acyl-coenzyme A thioesterase PaaI-like protein
VNILETWRQVSRLPGGKYLFSALLGRRVPYTGTLRAYVDQLEPGFARVELKDRPILRNHLQSIHAAALMNFAEAATGLAFIAGTSSKMRAILVGFEIDYLKKARGKLFCEARAPLVEEGVSKEYLVQAELKNEKSEVVCRVRAKWKAGPS